MQRNTFVQKLGLALAAGGLIALSLGSAEAIACEGHGKEHAKGDCAGKAGCGHDHGGDAADKADAKKGSGDGQDAGKAKPKVVKKGRGKQATKPAPT